MGRNYFALKPYEPTAVAPITFSPTPTPDQAPDWETFIHEDFNFSFDYPQELELKLTYNDQSNASLVYKYPIEGRESDHFLDIYIEKLGGKTLEVIPKNPYTFIAESPIMKRDSEVERVKAGPFSGYQFTEKSFGFSGTSLTHMFLLLEHDYSLYVGLVTYDNTEVADKKVFDQILSTFRFAD